MVEEIERLQAENKKLKDQLERTKLYLQVYKEDADRISMEYQELVKKVRAIAALAK